MKTFLEVEGKMGPIPQPTSSQYRSPHMDTNPNVRKDNGTEKRKRAVPTKRFRPGAAHNSSKATMHPPATNSKVPENRPPPLEKDPVHKSRNWLFPSNYLNNQKTPIKEEPKIGKQSIISPKAEKCGWGPNCPFCKNQEKEDWDGKHQNQLQQKTPPQPEMQMPQTRCPQTLNYQKPQDT